MFGALVRRIVFNRSFQENADTFKQLILLGHYEGRWRMPDTDDAEFTSVLEKQYALPVTEQTTRVQESVHRQVLRLFDRTVDLWPVYRRNPRDRRMYQLAIPLPGLARAADTNQGTDPSNLEHRQRIPSEDERTMAAIRERLGFVVRKRRSTIPHPEAGLGCFVDGTVRRGQVFCFYPGIVYLPHQMKLMKGYPRIDNENANLMARYDLSIIDAKDGGGIDQEDVLEHAHPLALGHYINHPPQGTSPNCMPYYYNFPLDFPPEFYPFVPNVYCRPLPWLYRMFGEACLMRSAVFIATRDIRDEEVFFNYRYNPQVPHPEWYSIVDAEQERNRWR